MNTLTDEDWNRWEREMREVDQVEQAKAEEKARAELERDLCPKCGEPMVLAVIVVRKTLPADLILQNQGKLGWPEVDRD